MKNLFHSLSHEEFIPPEVYQWYTVTEEAGSRPHGLLCCVLLVLIFAGRAVKIDEDEL